MRIIVKNLPQTSKETEITAHFSENGVVTDVFMLKNHKGEFRRVCFVGYSTDSEAEAAVEYFNNTYFKNHKISVEIAKENETIEKKETQLRRALYSKTVVIGNLTKDITEEILEENLGKYGRVLNIEMNNTRGIKAIVKFKKGEDAERVLKELKIISGRRVTVGNYMEKVVDTRREYYNSLFFNFESVIKRTCEAEKIQREDLLDMKDKSLGSRIALLETSLVDQTKKFLESRGIFLDKIIGKSETSIILRNSDILGAIDLIKGEFKVSIAPSKCLAILEFKNPADAARCYKEMNMRRFKNEVVHCEYAPVCEVDPLRLAEEKLEEEKKPSKSDAKAKIIVKNVPFQATQEELKQIFSSFTHVSEVRLPKKPDGSHRGFAFIVLDSPKNVDDAIEYFGSSTHLYGRRLVLEKAKL